MRYLGGKYRLAHRIIPHFPPHRLYCEPYAGAASVLLQKPRAYAEIYNDLDGDVVNLFAVLRDADMARRLVEGIRLTPFAREEFERATQRSGEPVEDARRLVVRSFMGHGSGASNLERNTGFRSDSNRSHTTPAYDWTTLPAGLAQVAERLIGVVIERRPALDIIARFDRRDALFYCDPPYMHAARSPRRARGGLDCCYAHEMSDADHEALLKVLVGVDGMVVLSGYRTALYDKYLGGWARREIAALADGARPRTEVLWINPAAQRGLGTLL